MCHESKTATLPSAQTRRRWCAPLPSSTWTESPADGVTCPASSLSLDANFSEMLLPDPDSLAKQAQRITIALCRDPGPLVESCRTRSAKIGHMCPRRLKGSFCRRLALFPHASVGAVVASSFEHLAHDLRHVGRQGPCLRDALQGLLGVASPLWLQCLPAAEGRQEPSRHLRVERVDLQHPLGQKRIAAPVPAVEVDGIARREGADQRPHLVWILDRKQRVLCELDNRRQRRGKGRRCLVGKPVVDDEMIPLPALVEVFEGLGALR